MYEELIKALEFYAGQVYCSNCKKNTYECKCYEEELNELNKLEPIKPNPEMYMKFSAWNHRLFNLEKEKYNNLNEIWNAWNLKVFKVIEKRQANHRYFSGCDCGKRFNVDDIKLIIEVMKDGIKSK